MPTGKTDPLLTVRIRQRRRGGLRVRMIKIRMDGPFSRRWINFAHFWWENNRGPIPDGKRVVHLDGDSLNDDPSNLDVLTPGDVAFLCHERDPKMSARNRERASAATSAYNRLAAEVRRQREWIPTRWYAVDPAFHTVINRPRRMRWQVYRDLGFDVDSRNWRWVRSLARGCGSRYEVVRGHVLASDPKYRGFTRSASSPGTARMVAS